MEVQLPSRKEPPMPETYVIRDQSATYFLTFTVVGWLDVFSRRRYCDIMVAAMNHCVDHKSLVIYSWVIMSNHIHVIMRSRQGKLSNTVRDLKRHTARKIITSILNDPESRRTWLLQTMKNEARSRSKHINHQFWAYKNHAVELPPNYFSMNISKLMYIHNNPVKAGLVASPEDYIYSSARDYAGRIGLVKVEVMDLLLGGSLTSAQ